MKLRVQAFIGAFLIIVMGCLLTGCDGQGQIQTIIDQVVTWVEGGATPPTPAEPPPKPIPFHPGWDGSGTVTLKAVAVAYVPELESGKPIWEHFHAGVTNLWFDPKVLCDKFVADIETVTWGKVRFDVDWRVVNAMPPQAGSFTYTVEEYLQDYASETLKPGPLFDYGKALEDLGIREKLERPLDDPDRVDEVWFFSIPGIDAAETRMGGKGAIFCNSPVLPETDYPCSRPFTIYYFNYQRGVDCMLENLGHRAENILGSAMFRYWQPYTQGREHYNPTTNNSMFDQFVSWEQRNPGRTGCGFVHLSPNSTSWAKVPDASGTVMTIYDWDSPDSCQSNCDGWLDAEWVKAFPASLGSATRTITCDEWMVDFPAQAGYDAGDTEASLGNRFQRLHHLWWLAHFPHFDGFHRNGSLLNWWKYVFAYEAARVFQPRREPPSQPPAPTAESTTTSTSGPVSVKTSGGSPFGSGD